MTEFLIVSVIRVEQVRAFRKNYTFCSGVTWLSYYIELTSIWKNSFTLKLVYCITQLSIPTHAQL